MRASSQPYRPQADMRRPGDNRAAQHAPRDPRNAPPAPSGRHSQEYHRQIERPRKEEKSNLRIADPRRPMLDKRPNHSGYGADGHEHKAEVHRLRDHAIERR